MEGTQREQISKKNCNLIILIYIYIYIYNIYIFVKPNLLNFLIPHFYSQGVIFNKHVQNIIFFFMLDFSQDIYLAVLVCNFYSATTPEI